jgi:hypothetical protein
METRNNADPQNWFIYLRGLDEREIIIYKLSKQTTQIPASVTIVSTTFWGLQDEPTAPAVKVRYP